LITFVQIGGGCNHVSTEKVKDRHCDSYPFSIPLTSAIVTLPSRTRI
jgi:hypothetical protein